MRLTLTMTLVLLAALLPATVSQPVEATSGTDRWVWGGHEDRGVDDGNDCADPASPCLTIAHALDEADPGDTIQVRGDWAYPETLVIDKEDVTLRGASGVASINPPELSEAGIRITADGVTVERLLIIDQQPTDHDHAHTLVSVEADGVQLLDNHYRGRGCAVPGDIGVLVQGTDEDNLAQNTLIAGGTLRDACSGFVARSNADGSASGFEVDGVSVSHSISGVVLEDVPGASVTSNFIVADTVGIKVSGSAESVTGTLLRFNNMDATSVGLVNLASVPVDARFNWWGSPLGPTAATNPVGAGAVVSGPAELLPHCLTQTCRALSPVASAV